MPANRLVLTYIGGPTAVIDFEGVRFLTDPTFDLAGSEYPSGPATLRKLTGPAIEAAEIDAVDYILLSHDHHSDNLDQTGRSLLSSAKAVLTTEAGASRLGANSIGLKPCQSVEVPTHDGSALRILATPARHGPAEMDRGPVIGFAVSRAETPDHGFYFSGDTVWYDGTADTARRFTARAAILNLGAARVAQLGPFHLTMTAAEAVEAARAFSNAAIVPLHFEGWQHFSEGRDQIAQAFTAAGMGERLHWPEPGRAIEVEL